MREQLVQQGAACREAITTHWAHEFFAACLVMQRRWIGAYMRERGWQRDRAQLIADVARCFGVSRRTAEVRLDELSHIDDERR